jgi:hypothetical protein
MTNRLICAEDIASITRATVAAEDAMLANIDRATIAYTAAAIDEVMLASPRTNITINHDEQGNHIPDSGNVNPREPAVNKEPGQIDEDSDSDDIPGLVHAPIAPFSTLSPRTAAMVLKMAGPDDGQILLANAKDLASTLRTLHRRLRDLMDKTDSAEKRAIEAEDHLEEIERNKENEPPRGRRRRRDSTNSSHSSTTNVAVRPPGFEENHGQALGFYIPDKEGDQIEPKYIRFVQGTGNPHVEGTEGQGCSMYRANLFAPPDFTETDLPLEQMPIWFTATLSRHNHMYNIVLQNALKHNNWGVCADIIHYRNCEDQIGIWEARVKEAAQRVERAREERTQARYHLEAARAHRHFAHLERTPREEDFCYDDQPDMVFPLAQLGRRG